MLQIIDCFIIFLIFKDIMDTSLIKYFLKKKMRKNQENKNQRKEEHWAAVMWASFFRDAEM